MRYWSQASNVSSKPQPSPKTKLEKEHTKQDIKPRTKLITNEGDVAFLVARIVTVLFLIAMFVSFIIQGKAVHVLGVLLFGYIIFGISTILLGLVFLGIIKSINLIWEKYKNYQIK